tara:strand:+ start:147 stop:542 length:396 start_codon:yes stop_codon:yes gene_type:complete
MIQQIIYNLTSLTLGVMIFFSFVVAPTTFRFLDEQNSRRFIRGIFPFYYILNFLLSLIIVVLFAYIKNFSISFFLIIAVSILFLISNFLLMPLINKFRDNKEDKKFKISHFISVIINFIQIFFLILILFKV